MQILVCVRRIVRLHRFAGKSRMKNMLKKENVGDRFFFQIFELSK